MNAHEFKAKLKKMDFDKELTEKAAKIVDEALEKGLRASSSYTHNKFSVSVYLGGAMGSGRNEEYKSFAPELVRNAVERELTKRGFTHHEFTCNIHSSQQDGDTLTINLHWQSNEGTGDSRDLDYRY